MKRVERETCTYAREAFFLLRGFTAGSLPASAPVSLVGGGGGAEVDNGAGADSDPGPDPNPADCCC